MPPPCCWWPTSTPASHVASFGAALIAALVLGLVNAFMRPILVILTLPVTLLTLGLFLFVINALLFWLVAEVVHGFTGERASARRCWARSSTALITLVTSWLLFKRK